MRWALLFLFLPACHTKECEELDGLIKGSDRVMAVARARAGLKNRIKERAEKAEADAKKVKAELGLDLAEDKLQAVLDERVKAVPGAKLERSTRVTKAAQSDQTGDSETLWTISFHEKSDAKAFEAYHKLIASPPIFRITTVLREEKGDGWRVELVRAEIEEIPIKVQPSPLPKRKTAADVPSELGFCGAGEMRKKLESIDGELAKLEADGLETTTLLPAAASWEGLMRRAQLVHEVETESRRIVDRLLDGVKKSGVRFKAAGVEGELVVLELFGQVADRAKLQKSLDEDIVAAIVLPEGVSLPGVVRLTVPNRVAAERRRPDQGGDAPLPNPNGPGTLAPKTLSPH